MEQSTLILDSLKFHKSVRETFLHSRGSFETKQVEDANAEIRKWQATYYVVKTQLMTVSKKIRAKLGFSEIPKAGDDSIGKEK